MLEAIERVQPDAVVVDGFLFGAMIGAEKSGLPVAVLRPDIGFRALVGRSPFGLGLPPARSVFGRLRDSLLNRFVVWTSALAVSPLNALSLELDLPKIRSVFDLYEYPKRHLLLTSEYFDFPITKPENLSYAGPQVDDPVWSKDWTPAWTPSDREKVLVSLGSTFQNQTEIYLRIIDALKALSLDAIVTLGDVPELPESLYTQANEQIFVVSSAPPNVVLKYVDLVVSNGGHGTVLRTLSAGVPLICMPLGRDQKDNAQRVKALGVGRMLDPSASSLKIQSAVSELLGDPHYQIQTECLAEKIGIEVKAGIAVRELESLIETDQSL